MGKLRGRKFVSDPSAMWWFFFSFSCKWHVHSTPAYYLMEYYVIFFLGLFLFFLCRKVYIALKQIELVPSPPGAPVCEKVILVYILTYCPFKNLFFVIIGGHQKTLSHSSYLQKTTCVISRGHPKI